MNILRIATLLLLTACAGTLKYPGAPEASTLYDSIIECSRNVAENEFQSKCSEKFHDSVLTAKVEAVDLSLLGGMVMMTANAGAHHKSIRCSLATSKYRSQLDPLSKGDLVTLRGTPSTVSLYLTSRYIELNPCELQDVSIQPKDPRQ